MDIIFSGLFIKNSIFSTKDLISPFSHKKYIDDITKLRHIGHVDSDKQKNSPISAGARGLARTHDFAFNKPTQMMRYNQNATEDIKNILKTIDTLNK